MGQDPQNEEKLYPLSHKDLLCDFKQLGSANQNFNCCPEKFNLVAMETAL